MKFIQFAIRLVDQEKYNLTFFYKLRGEKNGNFIIIIFIYIKQLNIINKKKRNKKQSLHLSFLSNPSPIKKPFASTYHGHHTVCLAHTHLPSSSPFLAQLQREKQSESQNPYYISRPVNNFKNLSHKHTHTHSPIQHVSDIVKVIALLMPFQNEAVALTTLEVFLRQRNLKKETRSNFTKLHRHQRHRNVGNKSWRRKAQNVVPNRV